MIEVYPSISIASRLKWPSSSTLPYGPTLSVQKLISHAWEIPCSTASKSELPVVYSSYATYNRTCPFHMVKVYRLNCMHAN